VNAQNVTVPQSSLEIAKKLNVTSWFCYAILAMTPIPSVLAITNAKLSATAN
jgi:hypothetical protein